MRNKFHEAFREAGEVIDQIEYLIDEKIINKKYNSKPEVKKMPDKFTPQILSDEEIETKAKEFEELMKNGGQGFRDKFKKFFDINKDGVVNKKDVSAFFFQLLSILALVYGFLIYLYWDQILQMIMDRNVDELFLKQIFLSTALSMVVAFLRQKYSKDSMKKDKVIAQDKLIIEADKVALKKLEDEKRQMELKFEIEQYRKQVEFEVDKLQYTTDTDIVIKVKDAIARLEMEYNQRLQKLLEITHSSANAILDEGIQGLPNIEKVGVVDSIVTDDSSHQILNVVSNVTNTQTCQLTQTDISKQVSSVSVIPTTDKPSETLNQATVPKS